MMLKNIQTIEQLKKEKQKLRMTMEVTRDAFVESLDNNRKQVSHFLIENIAIPASIFSLGTIAAKKFAHSGKSKKEKVKNNKSIFKGLLRQLFPVALHLVQAFLLQNQNEKMQQDSSPEATAEKSIHPPLKSVS